MLRLRISGTKNELKSFRKWIRRAIVILPKYRICKESNFKQNSEDGKYYRWEADLFKPLYEEGGINYVQSNCNSKPEGRSWKNYHNN